jgi:hypothetical protein
VAVKYSFTVTDILRSIANLKCAIGEQSALLITDLKNGNTSTLSSKISDMQLLLYVMEGYNVNYLAEDSINCLSMDEMSSIMQKAKQLMELCGCNSPTRPVTIPDFYY